MIKKDPSFSKRHFINTFIVILAVSLLLFTFLLNSSLKSRAATSSKPNIILFLTDDETAPDLSNTPKVQSLLVSQGTTFSKFYFNIAQCCPSRSSIQRGQYSHNTQIQGNDIPSGGFTKFFNLGEQNSTVATMLQNAQYTTVLMGKYLNNYPAGAPQQNYIPPGWTEFYSPIDHGGYSEFNYTLNDNGTLVFHGNTPADYLTDLIASKSADFINRNLNNSNPLFMYISPYCPHHPATPPDRYSKLFLGAKSTRSPSYNETDVSDKPSWINTLPLLTKLQRNGMDSLYRKRLQCLQAVDDLVETTINALQATGRLSNSYIFFLSDNGFHEGQHRLLQGKDTAYEEDINFPLVVRGPGVLAGQTNNSNLIGNIDLLPTFADLAGIQPPADLTVDGRSFASLLAGGTSSTGWRNSYLIERGALDTATESASIKSDSEPLDSPRILVANKVLYFPPPYTALRTNDYLYVEYTAGEKEFYNVTLDPYELTNTYSSADPGLLSSLSSILHSLQTCAGDSCRAAEDQSLIPSPTNSPTPSPTNTPTPLPPTDTPTPTP